MNKVNRQIQKNNDKKNQNLELIKKNKNETNKLNKYLIENKNILIIY